MSRPPQTPDDELVRLVAGWTRNVIENVARRERVSSEELVSMVAERLLKPR